MKEQKVDGLTPAEDLRAELVAVIEEYVAYMTPQSQQTRRRPPPTSIKDINKRAIAALARARSEVPHE